MQTPFIVNTTLVTAGAVGGSSVIDFRGADRGAVQFAVSGAGLTTSTITLTASLDGVNYNAFSTAKTLAVSGTTNGWFDLGPIQYPFLKVSWTTPGAGVITIVATVYGIATTVLTNE